MAKIFFANQLFEEGDNFVEYVEDKSRKNKSTKKSIIKTLIDIFAGK